MMFEELFSRLFKRHFKSSHFIAKIISVDKENDLCIVQEDEGVAIEEVRLVAIEGDYLSKQVTYPVIGSSVVVAQRYNRSTECYVTQCSEIESVKCQVGEFNMLLNKDGFVFNGGKNGGLINIRSLVNRINRLEERMSTHQHLANGSPTAPDPATNTPLTITQVSEIEDSTIKH